MALRKMLPIAFGAAALISLARADAQSPFTIKRPPEDSTVREKVRVEIPRSSIKEGGFVAFYIDDKFYVALSPKNEGAEALKPFTFIWDTKEAGVSDGVHSIKAILYEPAEGANKVAVTEKSISEVKVTVANKIKDGPRTLALRYQYKNGANLTYNRDSKSLIVGGISPNGMTTSDETLSSIRSKFLIGIEDSRPSEDVALVRNKMTALSVLAGTQETNVDPAQLSGSMFQELNSRGKVLYETGGQDLGGLTSAEGQPILTTLELPLLPSDRKTVGSTWVTPAERLDVPGLTPEMQPRVPLSNKLEGLEWEGGFKTAKIHQEAKEVKLPAITFGAIEVTAPTIKYERDIYLAYTSGTLVKTTRTITITGKTLSDAGAPPESGMSGGGGGAFMGSGMMPGSMGGGGKSMLSPSGAGSRMGAGPPGSMGGGRPGGSMYGGSMYGGPNGYGRPGSGSSSIPGSMGGMQMGGRPGSGSMGGMMGRGGKTGGDGDSGGFMRPGSGSMGGIPGMGGNRMSGGNTGGDPARPITLKSIAETEFQSANGGQTASR